jgi:hypothetical protein
MNETQPMTVRFRSRLLMQAIDDLAKTTAGRFHGSGANTPENCCAATLATTSSTSADHILLLLADRSARGSPRERDQKSGLRTSDQGSPASSSGCGLDLAERRTTSSDGQS